MNTITLTGREVLKLKRIDAEPKQDKKQQNYVRFAHNGTVFITREDFYTAHAAGNVREMDLLVGSREVEVEDQNGVMQPTTVASYELGGFITNTQDLALATHEATINAMTKKITAKYSADDLVADAVGA